mmetsp:Transcript_29239/g.66240  ORF Transcript_29239/g.66240 Transcript_29239/m.66240 type:complete len:314 (-) Transcript_29239:436-1377(-)
MVHGRVRQTLVLLPHPFCEGLRCRLFVPEGPLGCRTFTQYLYTARRSPDKERNVPHQALDALLEEVVATCILPATPICRHFDLRGQHDLVGHLEVHGPASPDHGVKITRAACLHTDTVVEMGTMHHSHMQPCNDEVVPGRRRVDQGRFSPSVYVSVDHVGKAVVDAHNDAICGRCILQMETQMLRRAACEINVVAKSNVSQGMECLKPLTLPHHCWPREYIQRATLWLPLVIDLDCYWCETTLQMVPVHHLDEQMPMVATLALVCPPVLVLHASLPPNAWLGVHWANCCPDLRSIGMLSEFSRRNTTVTARVL